jgi:Trypsin-co-occurring domain 2
MDVSDGIDLSEALAKLREQLDLAHAKALGSDIQFTVEKVEIELALEVTRSAEAGGEVKFLIFSAGAKGSYAQAATHRLKIELTPHDAQRQNIEIEGTVRKITAS